MVNGGITAHLCPLYTVPPVDINLKGNAPTGDPRQNDGVTTPDKGQLLKIFFQSTFSHNGPMCALPKKLKGGHGPRSKYESNSKQIQITWKQIPQKISFVHFI